MSVNKVILIGNVGKDPEVRYLDNGVAVANFSLATSERGYTTSAGVVVPERTEWHNLVLWRGLAEIAEKYVRKGSPIYVEGKIKTRSYDDQNGAKRYITEIFVDNMQLLGKRESQDNAGIPPVPVEYQTPTTQNTTPAPEFAGNTPTDDLPF